MEGEIVITYITETLKKENFDEREKAIYDSGYADGFNSVKSMNYTVRQVIYFIFITVVIFLLGHVLKEF